jgi:hypothetical protein
LKCCCVTINQTIVAITFDAVSVLDIGKTYSTESATDFSSTDVAKFNILFEE